MTVLLGIDAGGTRTRLRLARPDGTVLARAEHSAEDWPALGVEDKARAVESWLGELTGTPPSAVGLGAHGCDSEAECEQLRIAVQARLRAPVRVVNDAFLLIAAESAPSAGLVVGTGSVAVAWDHEGRALHTGGWGWLLGDPGSAWGTVRDAVRALHHAQDRGELDGDPLLPVLLRLAGADSLREVKRRMQRRPARSWAEWAPQVHAVAGQGSPAALAAIESGAQSLVDNIGDLLVQGGRFSRVIGGGSVLVNQPRLAARIGDLLRERFDLTLCLYRGEPVAGALALAAQLLDG
ncbi:N-acetylglucosamine kinase [Sciscionella marina]|uniref:N-acetylglucosamine kinase n=1 Tax=Sciscionella marina TaxID=508770 RepID=UPI000382CAC4|nr:BadF/BadG/BcrA/BcrD ATPase family protein [Sciscionella marina]